MGGGVENLYACFTNTFDLVSASSPCDAFSSRRLKYDIATSTVGLDLVKQLRPVTFKFNGKTKDNIGFIAEEVFELEPRLVGFDEEGLPNSVKYDKISSVLVLAVQEMNAFLDPVLAWFEGGKFHVQNDVCVDDVCVTKEEFKQILLNGGGSATGSGQPDEPAAGDSGGDVPTDGGVDDSVAPADGATEGGALGDASAGEDAGSEAPTDSSGGSTESDGAADSGEGSSPADSGSSEGGNSDSSGGDSGADSSGDSGSSDGASSGGDATSE